MTRMATAAIMRKTLMRAQRYMNKKEAGEDIYELIWRRLYRC